MEAPKLPEKRASAPDLPPPKPYRPPPRPGSTYEEPLWGGEVPKVSYELEVLRNGVEFDKIGVSEKSFYTLGRTPDNDIALDHESCSRRHAVIQHKSDGTLYLYDCGSTHGTIVNKIPLKKGEYHPFRVGDVAKFGASTRLYVLCGPEEYRPEEAPSKQEIMERRLAAQLKGKSAAEPEPARRVSEVTWGFGEDAVEDNAEGGMGEDWMDENGSVDIERLSQKTDLNSRQRGFIEKIRKQQERIDNLQLEIKKIKAKEWQGELTEGQQNQISRNEQRIQQLTEQLGDTEEELADSLRDEKMRAIAKLRKKKRAMYDDDDDMDDFYDRTEKKKKKVSGSKPAETVESLKSKREETAKLRNELVAELQKAILAEQDLMNKTDFDPLENFMDGLSANVAREKVKALEAKLKTTDEEDARLCRLLNIAQPTLPPLHVPNTSVQKPSTNAMKSELQTETAKGSPHAAEGEDKATKKPSSGLASILSTVRAEKAKEQGSPKKTVQKEVGASIAYQGPTMHDVLTNTLTDGKGDEPAAPAIQVNKGGLQIMKGRAKGPSAPHPRSGPLSSILASRKQGEAPNPNDQPEFVKASGTLDEEDPDYDWKPPEGQTGDGTTSLNARFGY